MTNPMEGVNPSGQIKQNLILSETNSQAKNTMPGGNVVSTTPGPGAEKTKDIQNKTDLSAGRESSPVKKLNAKVEKSEIRTTDNITDLNKLVDSFPEKAEVLVLSDLDLTLIRPLTLYGSPLLFDWTLERTMKDKNMSKEEAISFLVPLNQWLNKHAESVPVEGDATRETIRLIQHKVTFMGCTARRAEMSEHTLRQLEIANLPLGIEGAQDFSLTDINGRVEAAFQKGVLFTGSKYSKGEVVQKFLAAQTHNYKHIVLIDDLEDNLMQMAVRVNEVGINFIGLHYRAYKETALKDEEAIKSLAGVFEKHSEFAKYHYLIAPRASGG